MPHSSLNRNIAIGVTGLAVILIVLVAYSVLQRSSLEPAPFPTPAATRDDRWRQDVDYFATEIARLHYDAFRITSRAEFEAAVADLHAAIPELTDDQIVVALMAIVASIGDEHTQVDLLAEPSRFALVPLGIRAFEEDVYISSAPSEYAEIIGRRILAVGEIPIESAFNTLNSLVVNETPQHGSVVRLMYLRTPRLLHALGLIPSPDSLPLQLEGDDVTINIDVEIVGANQPVPTLLTIYDVMPLERPISVEMRDPFYWFEYLPETETLYFQYNECNDNPDYPFSAFNNDLFAFIDSHRIARIIVDLRRNGGGSDSILDPFIHEIRQRETLNQPERLFVLIGRYTFSSAVINAADLRTRTRATLVGESTGGRVNGPGPANTFTLPNSGLLIVYATGFVEPYPKIGESPMEPDVLIEETINAWRTGVDSALDYALHRDLSP